MSAKTRTSAGYSEPEGVRPLQVRTRLVEQGGEAVGEGAVELVERDVQDALDRDRGPADDADDAGGGAERLQRGSGAGDQERARALAEQLGLAREAGDGRADPAREAGLG